MPLSLGNRVFWSIALMILIGILWIKFIEGYITAWGALVVGFIASALIIRYGGRELSLRAWVSKIARGTQKKSAEKSD